MKYLNTSFTPAVLALSVPLLILGGCAGRETVKLSSDENIEMIEPLEIVDGSNMQTGIVVDFVPAQEFTDVVETTEAQDVMPEVTQQTLPQKSKTPKPAEGLIGFAFDEANINAEYGEMLWQHVQYLQENKNLILTVNGHTDSSGARAYNEMLSLKRAQQVANILIDFGVPKARIKVLGNASDQPLAGAINQREHRRVELDFEDTQLVSN